MQPESVPLPLPFIDPDNTGFWEACRRQELVLQRCADCKAYRHPPRTACHLCSSTMAEWSKASGHGKIYSFVVTIEPLHPAFLDMVPFAIAVVELEEGVLFTSNVVGCEPSQIRIGMPVQVVFEDINQKISLPKFKPYQISDLAVPN